MTASLSGYGTTGILSLRKSKSGQTVRKRRKTKEDRPKRENKQKESGKASCQTKGRRVSCWAVYSSVWRPFFAAIAPALGVVEPFATADGPIRTLNFVHRKTVEPR